MISEHSSNGFSPVHEKLVELLDRLIFEPSSTPDDSPWLLMRRIAKEALERNWSVFLIGGALRDLAFTGLNSKPRDFDLVFRDVDCHTLVREFSYMSPSQNTSLGGLRFRFHGVSLDIWPLDETFEVRHKPEVRIQDVPKHAFLNIEAIAVELSPRTGKARQIAESGFTGAILNKTIDINYESNPFPEICFLKSVKTAISLDLLMGRGLMEYIAKRQWSIDALMAAQLRHYGSLVFDRPDLMRILELVGTWDQVDESFDPSNLRTALENIDGRSATRNAPRVYP